LVVYLDDIAITGDDTQEISELKLYLQKKFQTKDLKQLRYFLDIEIVRLKKWIIFSQRKYVINMFSEADMLGCKSVDSPINTNSKLLSVQKSF